MKTYFELPGLIKEYGPGAILKAGIKEIFRKMVRERLCRSYAQNWEDKAILKFIDRKEKGNYLEIGAYHPVRLSNTYKLYRYGWRGVVVEPNPEVEKLFHRIRPEDRLIRAGVGPKQGSMWYYRYPIPALNTFSPSQVKENIKQGYRISEKTKINIIGIRELLRSELKNKIIDLLSLDAEGWDEAILNNWDWNYKPKLICVEEDNTGRIGKLLNKQGYTKVWNNRVNGIYKREISNVIKD